MTCAKCIHFADCLKDGKTRYYGEDAACNNVEKLCKFFKDKSRFIELPCKVGEVVYCIDDSQIKPCLVLTFYVDFVGIMCDLKISQNGDSPNALSSATKIIQFTPCDIFLTRAEAEKALKEREQK